MGTARTKPTNVTYLPARDINEMVQALSAALTIGYRGTIMAYLDVAQQTVWTMELNGPEGSKPVQVSLGNILIWDDVTLRVVSTDEFLTNYDMLDGLVEPDGEK